MDEEDIFIKRAFKCNVAIEYGMAETGVVAYTLPKSSNLKFSEKASLLLHMKINLI